MNPALVKHPMILELRPIVLRISLVSQVSAASLGQASKSSDEDIGGRRPAGGLNWKDDREAESHLKSAVYFQRKLERCNNSRQLEALLKEAREALKAWLWTPAPKDGIEPERGSFYWKCRIADDDRPIETIKDFYTVSRATVYRYRAKYRGLRVLPSSHEL